MPSPSWMSLYPFDPHWFEIAGDQMQYVDIGPRYAPVLLFVHGNPTWSFHWRSLLTALSDRFRCVAPDHLGCGLSDKPAKSFRLADRVDHLAALVEHLDLRRVTLVAQDWGGAIGLGAALRAPQRFERIVLLNTGAFPPPKIPARIAVCRTPVLGRMAVQGLNLFSLAALQMTLARRDGLDPLVAAAYVAPYDTWDHRRAVYDFVEDIPAGPGHPTWGVLQQIEAGLPSLADRPALLVWGMKDWCFAPWCLERFLGHWPDAQAVRVADAGHWVLEDAPKECLRAIEGFLAL
ncbi:Haloalkane dehalogenase [Pirellulimonas nuda]|uniref:Haloalkane dehalogenase n=1 Tax=Pirellulimonas nuda TaxID=2528009 RepID=A0A518DJZ0_9BACT|nr:alpha/beta fold hydrolase [Pirellulimonas nuda]QDU91766.1 Haloalkane dehalogenase [Pirellulimonas nuda]